ncbi:MAG: zinc ribbon domain-containing protein, partial [Lachnospiraceae bacterium]|nr:zinc ribbon domain-containing protein [Lachnospiraceae bacterium]
MYQCKNCGGELRFDVATQALRCQSCKATFNPYNVEKERDAEYLDFMEVNVFRCTQCGAEIQSEDQSISGFCSYCGAATVLDKKIEKVSRPKYIIPFQIKKEYCINEFQKRVEKDIYAPDELKITGGVEALRGIYMPYWMYHFKQSGIMNLRINNVGSSYGNKGHSQSASYVTNELIKMTAEYDGMAHDASSTFPDRVSEKIGPYDIYNRLLKFSPAFLTGFYADSSDIPSESYMFYESEHCKEISVQRIKNRLSQNQTLKSSDEEVRRQIKSELVDKDLAMFPVWFLSLRRHNRISHIAVNGQTGKLLADIPISIKKFVKYTLLLALPIFILLFLIPGSFGEFSMICAMLMTLLAEIIY